MCILVRTVIVRKRKINAERFCFREKNCATQTILKYAAGIQRNSHVQQQQSSSSLTTKGYINRHHASAPVGFSTF